MKPFSLKALSVALPVAVGAPFLQASPVAAAGATETKVITTTHKNGVGANITCTLKFTIISNYQNVPNRYFASYDITNTTQCRNASFTQELSWVTPQNGSGLVRNTFGGVSLIPAHSEGVYSPVNPSVATAHFTESSDPNVGFGNGSFRWDDCVENCDNVGLALTADGVANK